MDAALITGSLAILLPCSSPSPRGSPVRLRRREGPLPRLRASAASGASSGGVTDPRGGSAPLDVIGIGSRKDAVIDFCLASASSFASRFRFWTVQTRESMKVELLQKCLEADTVLKNVEFPLSLQPSPPALILIASAGHGLDHVTAIELLNSVKSGGGLTVAILLRPFSFEGQRRQEEVNCLANKLRECSHLYIVVEADSLLQKEVETLAEALESENNAIFMAINTIYVLISELHLRLLSKPDGEIKEVRPSEVLKLLASYGEARIGFGAGYNIRSAIRQAVFSCPFLNRRIKDLNGLVIFTLASSSVTGENDLLSTILTFRRVTGCTEEIIFSRIHEPDLEPNLIVITLLVVGYNEKEISQKKSFLSGLALRFPFLLSLLGRGSSERNPKFSDDTFVQQLVDDYSSPDHWSISSSHLTDGDFEYLNRSPVDLETKASIKESNFENKENRDVLYDVSHKSAYENDNKLSKVFLLGILLDDYHIQLYDSKFVVPEEPGNHRQQSCSWNTGPGYHIAQQWARERAACIGINNNDKLDIFTLSVGVKSSDWSQYPETVNSTSRESRFTQVTSSKVALTEGIFEAITSFYNSSPPLLKGKCVDESGKQGLLSSRAASMLEAERESQKNWTPVIETEYRGGIYKGRCQGGLPEGKGRLTFTDGSFYYGMWRFGKRSGPGTFCYSNGDVFQGVWRDDLMHGKGWFYFHTGDRWFANFWKGKADGEGRFYSKDGSIFFGHFRDGWRHDQCLCIDADGLRWAETWDEGVLVSRTQLDEEIGG